MRLPAPLRKRPKPRLPAFAGGWLRLGPALAGLVAALLAPDRIDAADWPSWRGPRNDGVCLETNAPTAWSLTKNIRWKAQLPARGNSSPIIWRDTVYITDSRPDRRRIIAYDRRNGRARWNAGVDPKSVSTTSPSNPAASSSPVTDGEHLIAWFGSDGLHAWDMEGNRLWSLDLGPQRHQWGYGSTPVLDKDRIYLNFGPGAEEFIVAVDKRTGRELWRARGPSDPAEDSYGTWSTPRLVEVAGKPQLLVALRDYFAGLDPANGAEIWRCDGMGRQAKASPIFAAGIAVMSGDLKGAEIAVRVDATTRGNVTDTHRLWREFPPRSRIGTAVVVDGYSYGGRANGVIDCVSLETGDVVWEKRLGGAGGFSPIWSSPILVGNLVYIVNQGGDTAIVEASPKFRLIRINSLKESGNASPAVAYGDLFIRTHTTLWCIQPDPIVDALAATSPAKPGP